MANLSQERREKMLAFLETLKEQHSDDESLIALGEIERELKAKKYGLVWEEHEEEVDVKMRTHIPVFTADDSKEINADTTTERYNFLLEGDNLHSLQLLEKTHRGQIDVIYIDPPYNTGANDFVYDDEYVDTIDGFRHSKWISFMARRLQIAQKLLSNHGVIFISIDDNEMAQLKLLCDDIFGMSNFVGMILWKKKTNGNNMGWLPPVHDYILCYAKNIEQIYDMGFEVTEEELLAKYSNPDNDPRGPWTTTDLSANHVGPSFPITNPKTGQVFNPPAGRYWVFNEQEVLRRIEDGRIIFGKSGDARPVQRVFAKERGVSKRKAESWWDKTGMNSDATQELKDVFNQAKVFTHPKPVQLIKDLIRISCDKNDSIILDFFAGSGTTAQAVLELNQQDGGNRKFILCTNNENNICETLTYQRIRTIATGVRRDGSTYSREKANKVILLERKLKVTDLGKQSLQDEITQIREDNNGKYSKIQTEIKDATLFIYGIKKSGPAEVIPSNLMYFRTDFVDKESDELSDELLAHIREMIQLEHGIKIDDRKYVVILTEEEMDEFEENIADYPDLKAVFINSDIFLSAKQQKMLNDVDSYVIPDYYFDFELREAGEIW
ncbi:MAG: site-specific DNA-methyltransferase [Ruminococcus sp.]|nr:site-specific DNA-methyltransferase [Ruminococcus sp.]